MMEHRLTMIEGTQDRHKERLDGHDERLDRHDNELKDIVKLLSTRPTWLTAGLLTVLTSVTAGLIVYVLTTHH